MMKKLLTVSFCDGISAAQYIMQTIILGFDLILDYHAFEIDSKAIMVAQHHFPNMKQNGDIRNWRLDKKLYEKYKKGVYSFFGGTSCKYTSQAGKRTGLATLCGKPVLTLSKYKKYDREGVPMNESTICFWETVWFIEEMKPRYIFLEIPPMPKKFMDVFIKELKLPYIMIDSALVSGQSRKRYYFTNIPGLCQPKDKKIMITDIIPGAASYSKHGIKNPKFGLPGEKEWGVQKVNITKSGKLNTITTKRPKVIQNGEIRMLTPQEAEIFMGFKVGYVSNLGLTITDIFRMLGNSWSVPTVLHIFKGLRETELFKKSKK